MIHEQLTTPIGASIGDAWVDPHGSFKRVLSRGGAWENVNPGAKHPDEVDHEQGTQPEAQLGDESSEVPSGTGESASGNGDDGQAPESAVDGEENAGLTTGGDGFEGEGVDGNGSPVV